MTRLSAWWPRELSLRRYITWLFETPQVNDEAVYQESRLQSSEGPSLLFGLATIITVVLRTFPQFITAQPAQIAICSQVGDLTCFDILLNWAMALAVVIACCVFRWRRWLRNAKWDLIWCVVAVAALCSTCIADGFVQTLFLNPTNSEAAAYASMSGRLFSTQVLGLLAVVCLPLRLRGALLASGAVAGAAALTAVLSHDSLAAPLLPDVLFQIVLFQCLSIHAWRCTEQACRQDFMQQETVTGWVEAKCRSPNAVSAGGVLRRAGCRTLLQLDTGFQVIAANNCARKFFSKEVEGSSIFDLVDSWDVDRLRNTLQELAREETLRERCLFLNCLAEGKKFRCKVLMVFDKTSPPDYFIGIIKQETTVRVEETPRKEPQDREDVQNGAAAEGGDGGRAPSRRVLRKVEVEAIPGVVSVVPVESADLMEEVAIPRPYDSSESDEEGDEESSRHSRRPRSSQRVATSRSSISLTYSVTHRSLAGLDMMVDQETETDIVWDVGGYKCKRCQKPPLMPGKRGPPARLGRRMPTTKDAGLNGRWVLFPEFVSVAFPWLYYIHIRGHLAIDGLGRKWRLELSADGRPELAGGALIVDSEIGGVMHREGRSGVRLTFGHLSEVADEQGSPKSRRRVKSSPVPDKDEAEGTGIPPPGSPCSTGTALKSTGIDPEHSATAQAILEEVNEEDATPDEAQMLRELGIPSRSNTQQSLGDASVRGVDDEVQEMVEVEEC